MLDFMFQYTFHNDRITLQWPVLVLLIDVDLKLLLPSIRTSCGLFILLITYKSTV